MTAAQPGPPVEEVDVAIVGGGPSGLTAAAALAGGSGSDSSTGSSTGSRSVLVIEREAETGGIPRHSDHLGYGLRDLRRFVSGPAYARRLTAVALGSGARLETEAQVTGWNGERELLVTSPRGRRIVRAGAVVLATGARERPRPARRIPGDRPDGVYTTGQLQNLVHRHHATPGTRAVVVGAELVSWSAVLTLREAGCATVAMTTEYPRSEAYAAFRALGRAVLRVPVLPRSRVVEIVGRRRVESVVVEDLASGRRRTIECDTVVLTGDWIPDHELARLAGLRLDPATRGPVVTSGLATSGPGVFAVGNLVHPVDTADAAALDGRHVAGPVRDWLARDRSARNRLAGAGSPQPTVRIVAAPPLRWVTPQLLDPAVRTPRDQLLLWSDTYRRFPTVAAVQAGRVLERRRLAWPASPGRIFRVPSALVEGARPGAGDVRIELS